MVPLLRTVTTHHRGHDGCVDDPEVLDSDDAALLVDDGGRVGGRAHLARARRVVRGVRLGPGLGNDVTYAKCHFGMLHKYGVTNLVGKSLPLA